MADPLVRERTRRWAILALVLAVAAAAGIAGVWGALDSAQDDSVLSAVVQLAIGSSFVAAGCVAWWTRPDNRTGVLMTVCGLAFTAGSWQVSSDGWLFIAGAVFSLLSFATFVHLILAFPEGVIRRQADRWLVGVAYAFVVLVVVLVPLVEPNETGDCPECPSNPVAIAQDETVTTVLLHAVDVILAGSVLVLLVLLVLRWRGASGPERRRIAPVLWAALVATSALVVTAVLGLVFDDTIATVPSVVFLAATFCVPIAFLVGLLRDRLQRSSAMQDLVVRLAAAEGPHDLRLILATALRDPGLQIAFWFPERELYVDHAGHPLEVPERGVTVVERDGEQIARLVHDPTLEADPGLLQAVAAAAAIGLERARLEAELRARLDELRASRARIVEAVYTARRRLERDLHDGAQQRLVALSLNLRMIRARVGDDPSTMSLVDGAQAELGAALEELRELARGIHPAILTDRGLEVALQSLADRATLPVDLDVPADLELPPALEAAVYFVASEALANVAKYADASRAAIRVRRNADHVIVQVADDGVGGATLGGGTGLAGLRDRVEALGGRFDLDSPAGAGTLVGANLPAPPLAGDDRAPTASASA